MAIYEKADRSVNAFILKIARKFHKPLCDAGVTFGAIMAHPSTDKEGEPKGPAVKLHGYKCAAVVRVTKLKERVYGLPDVEITIDAEHWDGLDEDLQAALIDHELEHIKLATNKLGELQKDDRNRPVLKAQLHDWQLGGFESVARRHGQAAAEVIGLKLALQKPALVEQREFLFPD
jgi:hypothetical protein